MKALQLFKDWQGIQIRDCNYRTHRLFTLRCITKGLVPVSIKLKTTIKTEKARKIIRKAERDLQARVKSINSLLGNNAKQRDLCRSQLASILSTSTMNKCQEFIDKVSEFRYLKVKERQINKFNRLLQRKEGNITWSASATSTPVNSTLQGVSASFPKSGSTSPQGSIAPQTTSNWPGRQSVS